MILKNVKAVITGAGSGMGKATAELFSDEGAITIVIEYYKRSRQLCIKSSCCLCWRCI